MKNGRVGMAGSAEETPQAQPSRREPARSIWDLADFCVSYEVEVSEGQETTS